MRSGGSPSLILSGTVEPSETRPRSPLDLARRAPLVVAHRGASRAAPGNSLDAFESAIAAGADAVELDVRQTADGVLVVHHGASRRGTPVSLLTHAELRRRCRNKPPTLDEAVRLCAGRVILDVEVKEQGFEPQVLEVLAAHVGWRDVLITSFHPAAIAAVKALRSDVACGLLIGTTGAGRHRRRIEALPLELAERCGADFIAPHQLWLALRPHSRRRPLADSPLLAAAHGAGLPVVVWTVNGQARLRRYLADPRVAGIITDLPALAVHLRRISLPAANPPSSQQCPNP